MKYKLIAMDFDGTLLTTDKKITDKTKQSIDNYKEKGYIIVGVTARNLDSVKSVCDINMFNYLILNNGNYIYDIKTNDGNYKQTINKKDYYDITESVEEYCRQIDFCSSSTYYTYKSSYKNQRPFIKNISNLEEINEEIARINLHLLNQEEIEKVNKDMNNNYKNLNCFIMQDSDGEEKWLVISPKGINKGSTLIELGKKLNIEKEEMIFFGDGPNDLDVLELVGYSVAMNNALPEVKQKAKFITLSNNEDGIAYFLQNNIK